MRCFPLLPPASVALFPIPGGAAVNDASSLDAIFVAAACPKIEGYPDRRPDDESRWNARSGRAFRTRS